MTGIERDRRGQLLLVGAVALAIIILGLSVVTNTVLFTENVGSGTPRPESPAIHQYTFETQKGARSLLLRLNHAERNVTMAQLEGSVTRNVSAYGGAFARSYATSGTVLAGLQYGKTVDNATRIVQRVDRNFTYPATNDAGLSNDQRTWSPIPASSRAEIGWLVFNVDLRNTSGDRTTVVVENATGTTLTYELNRSKQGKGSNLTISVSSPTLGSLSDTSCRAAGGRLLLDMRAGESYLGTCTFDGITTIEPPYSIRIEDGQRLSGQYGIVANRTWHSDRARTLDASGGGRSLSYPHCVASGQQPPCLAPVVWDARVTLTYASTNVDYATTRNISIYDGD